MSEENDVLSLKGRVEALEKIIEIILGTISCESKEATQIIQREKLIRWIEEQLALSIQVAPMPDVQSYKVTGERMIERLQP